MELSLSSHVSIPDNVLFRQLEEESVILHLETEMYYGLDDVGTRMWTVLTASESVRAAFEVLTAEYDTEPEILQKDLTGLIENLVDKGLLEIQKP